MYISNTKTKWTDSMRWIINDFSYNWIVLYIHCIPFSNYNIHVYVYLNLYIIDNLLSLDKYPCKMLDCWIIKAISSNWTLFHFSWYTNHDKNKGLLIYTSVSLRYTSLLTQKNGIGDESHPTVSDFVAKGNKKWFSGIFVMQSFVLFTMFTYLSSRHVLNKKKITK